MQDRNERERERSFWSEKVVKLKDQRHRRTNRHRLGKELKRQDSNDQERERERSFWAERVVKLKDQRDKQIER